MPVGIGVGAAVIGAGATIVASDKASGAQTKAANTAAATERANAEMNNKLARDMYGWNAARLDPYSSMGLAAGDAYMGILLGDQAGHTGSGWAPMPGTAAPAPTTGTTPIPGTTPAPSATPAPSGGTPLSQLAGRYAEANALAPAVAAPAPAPSALAPIVAQQAQAAIAAGADPAAVAARAASMGVQL